ncbi:MAG: hypothetical protein LBL96_01195 [Clostridiales bacterium]|jgi:hypothetical protein|nr:hypothetical protein [Clostridiales bacterium]
MNYLPMLTDDELKYVCSVIPLQESVWYFKRYPKDFAKIMPGFRATSLRSQEQVSAVLFRSRNKPFISSFIENHISRWIEEIQREISLITDKGESKESAWLQTLPFCFFVDEIKIFFKLTGEEQSEEYISLLRQSIRRIRDLDIEDKELKKSLNAKEQEQGRYKNEIERIQVELDKSRKKLIERSVEIKALKRTNDELERLTEVVYAKEQEIKTLEKMIQERDVAIKQLEAELSVTLAQQQLETRIREEFENKKSAKLVEQAASAKSKRPKDIDEFRDYLGYNLEDLDIETSAEYYSLLKDYLCDILFAGKPILVSRYTGFSLMKCVSNALVASPNVATFVCAPDISVEAIDEFLSIKNRIVCLDNFIGNFDEVMLSIICEGHRDKIIFLTVAYDKTLRYVPEEFLKYCYYLNVNRIKAFTEECDLTEDPSSVEEVEATISNIASDTLWAPFLKEILGEVAVCNELSLYKSSLVSDEASMCRLLAFDILPYCMDVLGTVPLVVSERLNKYISDNGRCPYKDLFRRWFF